MRITIVGPGRAGMSLATAAHRAGHQVVAVVGRDRGRAGEIGQAVGAEGFAIGQVLPETDLLVVAVRDDAIAGVTAQLVSPTGLSVTIGAVHLSGLAPVSALDEMAAVGVAVGSFHPLQTLPTPEVGARALDGAWVGITTDDSGLREALVELAGSLGSHPFELQDSQKALYHAAAAAASNFVIAALTMAHDLFEAAGVDFEAAHPLVDAVVANAFELGPRAALTGPVARGDVHTVEMQLDAILEANPSLAVPFVGFVDELARLTGRGEAFEHLAARAREAG